MIEACRRPANAGDIIGNACPSCGHTNVLHPGSINPAVIECLVCLMEGTLDGMTEMLLLAYAAKENP